MEGSTEQVVKIRSLPQGFTTKDLWDCFCEVGEIASLQFSEGRREGSLIFSAVYQPGVLKRGFHRVPHPRHGKPLLHFALRIEPPELRRYETPAGERLSRQKALVRAQFLSFGSHCAPTKVKLFETIATRTELPIIVSHDYRFHEIEITFPLILNQTRLHHHKIAIRHTNPQTIWEVESSNADTKLLTLVISVQNVPEFFVKHEDAKSHVPTAYSWNSRNAWYRKTDIPQNVDYVQGLPTTLRRLHSRINIGRWRVFCPTFDVSNSDVMAAYKSLCHRLEDFNIQVQKCPDFQFLAADKKSVWSILDGDQPADVQANSASMLAELQDESTIYLPFEVRYQLEVCISDGSLNEYAITREFIKALRDMSSNGAVSLLESIATEGKRVFDPMALLASNSIRSYPRRKRLPHDFTWVHSAVVTPTTIHYNTPVMEISNRVIRQFVQYQNRFLRVKFEEERPKGRLYSKPADIRGRSPMDEIYRRIRDTLTNGIDIGDRHYEFLGFGNSQIREHGAYFFASNEHMSAAKIRAWMGDFSHIRSVSKHASRIGQCFSTTRPVRGAVALVSEINDIWTPDGKHCFTDGVGIITRPMAQLSAMETGMATSRGESPSVIQFRAGGSKGVLAVHEDLGNSEQNRHLSIFIRPSQYKFHARTERLEIIRWSQFSAAHLNRQIICVLSALGVPDKVFVSMMRSQLDNIDKSVYNEDIAVNTLRREVDSHQMTLTVATMVLDGFMRSKEPFMISLLQLWRAWSIRFLKKNAKIAVKAGAVLLGCVDEYKVLEGHHSSQKPLGSQDGEESATQALPEVFVQLSRGESGKPEVITKPMVLARNPSLHPGDVRVVQGVDKPELRHLKDCVVFPQTGDRDLPSMCSGGDLDGDDFLVIWDPELLPPERNHEPMDFTPPAEPKLERAVTTGDIINFFVTYMQNDSLGQIANAHLATADREPDGVKNMKCLILANLHSQAVDYVKNGHPVQMTPDLYVRIFPHFMNFEKNRRTYHSKKVCGQLYDLVECVDFTPRVDTAFDTRILGRLTVSSATLDAAAEIKIAYDGSLRRIMQQYAIATELEVWSTFVMSAISTGSNFKISEVIGNLSSALKETYREECYRAAGSREDRDIVTFVAAMYEVTWNEVDRFNKAKVTSAGSEPRPPLISFPWLFPHILGKIANAQSISAITQEPTRSAYLDAVREAEASDRETGSSRHENHDPMIKRQGNERAFAAQLATFYQGMKESSASGDMKVRGSSDVMTEESSKTSEATGPYEQSADESEVEVTVQGLGTMSLLERLADQ